MTMKPFRVGLPALAVLFALPLVSFADSLELASEQPSVVGTAGNGSEQRAKPRVAPGYEAAYIVQLEDPSLAVYDGGVGNLAATSARATGKKRLNVNSKASKDYAKYLRKTQREFVEHCENAFGHKIEVRGEYQAVFNGVAMVLTEDEAKAISQLDYVKSIERERFEVMSTDDGPLLIGAPSIWDGPPFNLPHTKGEGAVVAILDSGINHDHPSFADAGGDGYDHENPLGSGNYIPGSYCDTNPGFCNDKLIGAWDMVQDPVDDPMSPEDSDGHGSHTASTAAGNVIQSAALVAPTATMVRDVTGVAPHANIIAYDVCVDSCPGTAILAALDQVVIDASNLPNGIAALNYSISGGNNPYNDSIELAFLNATQAGIYVATSAGNAGPGAETTGHNSPWVSATGATTHRRTIPNSVTDLNSDAGALADITGLGLTSGYGPAPIINSADLEEAFPGSTLCGLGEIGDLNPPWPPGTFNGEIVACTRGTFGRVEKGANALSAGAGGYILMDNGGGVVADPHALPGVHISQEDGAVLAAWLMGNPTAMGSISGHSVVLDDAAADIMAGFSSRGPNSSIDVIKPDLAAPGASIMAAEDSFSDIPVPEFVFKSGTSMASPHNAGSATLLSIVQPDWTPYEIKSALMMTAENTTTLKEDGSTPTDHFDVGGGRIDLTRAQEAGLVLDETKANFLAADPALGGDPKTLNIASMADSVCIETCSWTRTVENVTGHSARWDLSTSGPAGLGLDTNPGRKLKLKKGKTGEITVTADTTLATPGWNFAQLNLDRKGDGPDLHMPIAVFATNSSNPDLLSKSVDAATVAEDEPLMYEITITNGPISGQIDLTDALPEDLEFVPGSAMEMITNGTTVSEFRETGGGVLTWSGMLDPGGLQVTASPAPFGYFSLGAFGVAPFALPSNPDDGAFILNIPEFTYNNQQYSQVIWSINGAIEAGTNSGLALSAGNREMPDPAAPNNLIAPFWTDLNLTSSGNWYVAVLNAGPRQFTVYEWENAPLFSDPAALHTFQIWVENGPSGSIWFAYAQVPSPLPDATVGVENADGTNGFTYFFDGNGTAPAVGTDLLVSTQVGGIATFTFQAEVDDCDGGDVIVNRVNITGDGVDNTAIAVSQCVDDDSDSDSD